MSEVMRSFESSPEQQKVHQEWVNAWNEKVDEMQKRLQTLVSQAEAAKAHVGDREYASGLKTQIEDLTHLAEEIEEFPEKAA